IVSTEYDMITNISFKSSHTNCNITCIEQSALSSAPAKNFTLLSVNGTLVDVTPKSGPILVNNTANVTTTTTITTTTTTTTINYAKGESSPGVAAQLGMGLGITIIGILLIGEIIYFYRKYGLNGSMSHSSYELPHFHNRLSI
ncbi:unnamed protein product, partial [Rotaria sordida]